jgi:hypothetical protein
MLCLCHKNINFKIPLFLHNPFAGNEITHFTLYSIKVSMKSHATIFFYW